MVMVKLALDAVELHHIPSLFKMFYKYRCAAICMLIGNLILILVCKML